MKTNFLFRTAASFFMMTTMTLSVVQPGLADPAVVKTTQGGDNVYDPVTGALVFVGTDAGQGVTSMLGGVSAASVTQNAEAFVSSYASQLGLDNIADELVLTKTSTAANGRTTTRYHQIYQGIPVFATDVIVNTDANGALLSLTAKTSPNLQVDINPSLTADEAAAKAIDAIAKDEAVTAANLTSGTPELQIYDSRLVNADGQVPYLVWKLIVSSSKDALNELVLVDAHNGVIALHFQQEASGVSPQANIRQPAGGFTLVSAHVNQPSVSAAVLGTPMIEVYDLAGAAPDTLTLTSPPWPVSGTQLCDQSNAPAACTNTDALNAYNNALDFYNFFYTHFGRDSINSGGATIKATVHYDTHTYGVLPDPNTKDAYQRVGWLNQLNIATYRNGVPAAEDLAAHAISSGFPESGTLLNIYQPGAIKQSLGDIWGEFIEQHNGVGTESFSDNWAIGENSPPHAIRNMKTPSMSPFLDPDKMTSVYYTLTNPSTSILLQAVASRKNAGVNNKAAYLMTSGGSFNGKTVTGIGYLKVAHIYYEVETNLLAEASTYFDMYYAIRQACVNLTGVPLGTLGADGTITSANCAQVTNALDAVQMNMTKVAVAQPSYCPAGTLKSNTDLFRATSTVIGDQWSLSNLDAAADQWSIQTNESVVGGFRLHADDVGNVSSAALQITTPVALPINSVPYLYFRQRTDFQFSGTNYYDGGILQYSINGGTTWTDAAGLFNAGKNYGGILATGLGLNPLFAGKNAFIGFTGDYTPSRYNLTTLALTGQSVQFRWILASNNATGTTNGWDLDDVRIYECVSLPSIPALLAPANSGLMLNTTPTLDWTDSAPYLDHYELQVWNSITGNTFPADTSSIVDATIPATTPLSTGSTYTIPGGRLTWNTRYIWHVRAVNSAGVAKGWSAVRSFRTPLPTPVLDDPQDDPDPMIALSTMRPDFDWEDVTGATGYTIQVSKNLIFTQVILTATVIGSANSYYTPLKDLPGNTILFWRAKANGANSSPYSAAFRFETGSHLIPVPVLSLPANNVLIPAPYTPILKWKPITLSPGTTFKYFRVQVDDDPAFLSPVVNNTSVVNDTCLPACPSLLVSPALSPGTKYYWRVRAYVNEGGPDFSGWSLVRSFRAVTAAPTLLFPVGGQGSGVLNPIFDWNNPTGATSFTIQVDDNSNFSSPLFTKTIAPSQYQWTSALTNGKTLYWRVRASGPNGISPYSTTATFLVTTPPAPAISLDKSIFSGDNYTTPNATIVYHYLVTNTGNILLTSIAVTDDNIDSGSMNCPATSLAPSLSMTCTASHTVTQADLDANHVTNHASATASSAVGSPPASLTYPATDSAIANAAQSAAMTVTKSETSTGPSSGNYDVGNTITYNIVVTNTGNITLHSVSVTDPGTEQALGTCSPVNGSNLAPAATMTCPASHVVTQADVDANTYSNTAIATSTEVASASDMATVTTFVNHPELTLVKSVTSGDYYTAPGQKISYQYVVTNSGNVSLSGPVTVTDDKVTVDCTGDPLTSSNNTSPSNHDGDGSFDPGEVVTCLATGANRYTVLQTDLDDATNLAQDTVTNSATAHATAPDTSTVDSTPASTATATSGALFLSKEFTSGDGSYHYVGDTVGYTYTVMNNISGTHRAGPITVADDKINAGTPFTCGDLNVVTGTHDADGSLDFGESVTCTATYTVVLADLHSSVLNTAIAQSSDVIVTYSNRGQVLAFWNSAVRLVMGETHSFSGGTPTTSDTINYTFTLTNIGNVTLNTIALADAKCNSGPNYVSGDTNANNKLEVTETWSYTCTHTITSGDVTAGSVTNQASVTSHRDDDNLSPPGTSGGSNIVLVSW